MFRSAEEIDAHARRIMNRVPNACKIDHRNYELASMYYQLKSYRKAINHLQYIIENSSPDSQFWESAKTLHAKCLRATEYEKNERMSSVITRRPLSESFRNICTDNSMTNASGFLQPNLDLSLLSLNDEDDKNLRMLKIGLIAVIQGDRAESTLEGLDEASLQLEASQCESHFLKLYLAMVSSFHLRNGDRSKTASTLDRLAKLIAARGCKDVRSEEALRILIMIYSCYQIKEIDRPSRNDVLTYLHLNRLASLERPVQCEGWSRISKERYLLTGYQDYFVSNNYPGLIEDTVEEFDEIMKSKCEELQSEAMTNLSRTIEEFVYTKSRCINELDKQRFAFLGDYLGDFMKDYPSRLKTVIAVLANVWLNVSTNAQPAYPIEIGCENTESDSDHVQAIIDKYVLLCGAVYAIKHKCDWWNVECEGSQAFIPVPHLIAEKSLVSESTIHAWCILHRSQRIMDKAELDMLAETQDVLRSGGTDRSPVMMDPHACLNIAKSLLNWGEDSMAHLNRDRTVVRKHAKNLLSFMLNRSRFWSMAPARYVWFSSGEEHQADPLPRLELCLADVMAHDGQLEEAIDMLEHGSKETVAKKVKLLELLVACSPTAVPDCKERAKKLSRELHGCLYGPMPYELQDNLMKLSAQLDTKYRSPNCYQNSTADYSFTTGSKDRDRSASTSDTSSQYYSMDSSVSSCRSVGTPASPHELSTLVIYEEIEDRMIPLMTELHRLIALSTKVTPVFAKIIDSMNSNTENMSLLCKDLSHYHGETRKAIDQVYDWMECKNDAATEYALKGQDLLKRAQSMITTLEIKYKVPQQKHHDAHGPLLMGPDNPTTNANMSSSSSSRFSE